MNLDHLPTPSLILDRGIVARNTAALTKRLRGLGVDLRPHMKTAKSVDVAHLATEGNFGGITVSTLKEADYFLDGGFTDITYAVGITPFKLDQVAALMDRGADIKIITDNADVAVAITDHGAAFKVLIEIDTGDERGGTAPDAPELLGIARILNDQGSVTLMGILTHAGQTYDAIGADAIARVAEGERTGAVMAANRLREAGLPAPVVSMGSTPAALFGRDFTGVSEVRAGVYMFGDLFQAGLGVCAIGDIAVSVLASVIGHRRADNGLLLDAGALALSKDRSTAALPDDCGFGLVCHAETTQPIPGLMVSSINQEHGRVTADAPIPFDDFPIGDRVRVLPNHACITAAAYDSYAVVDGGTQVVDRWPRCNGW